MHLGRLHMEICSVWWTNKTFPKAHWNQTFPVSGLRPKLLSLRPSCPPQETPHARLKACLHLSDSPLFLALCLSHCPCASLSLFLSSCPLANSFLYVHFNFDSAGLNLWIYIIQDFFMVSSWFSNPPFPYHGSDLKNVNIIFSWDAKQTLLTDMFNVMRTREHVN